MPGDLGSLNYFDRIFFDSNTGVAGIEWPVGTAQLPSDVIADVITMCTARNLRIISVHGVLQLLAAMAHYKFLGYEHEDIADILDLNGQAVGGSHIGGLVVTGAQGADGFLTMVRCIAYILSLFNGRMEECDLYGSAMSFADGGYIDLNNCRSIHGVVTITVQAPARGSIKNYAGNLILTAQDGGVMFVRGFKGTLEIDAMTAGTLSVYANGADITINADCIGTGTINIYGNARVTDNHGAGTTVNDYTKETQLDDIETSIAGQLFSMDFWSDTQEELQVTAGGTTETLPSVTLAAIPGTPVIVRAIAMFKFRMVENTYAGVNAINAAQHIQVQKAGGAWQNAISLVDTLCTLADSVREGGDVWVGDHNIAGEVDDNAVYNFQWLNADSLFDFIQFNDIQVGLRIWYSV